MTASDDTCLRKRCSRCKRFLPAKTPYFNKNKNKKSGFDYHCRGCAYGWNEDQFQVEVLRYVLLARKYKQCRDCEEVKPLSEFGTHPHAWGGVRPECRICQNRSNKERSSTPEAIAKRKAYYAREDIKERQRERWQEYSSREGYKEWRQEYEKSERIRAYRKGYLNSPHGREVRREYFQRPDIRKKQNELKQKWYRENKEYRLKQKLESQTPEFKARRNEYQQKRYRENPKVKEQFIIAGIRRKSRKNNVPNTFTLNHWHKSLEYFGHSCAICGAKRSNLRALAADHWIPLSKGGHNTPENIVPLCHSRKGDQNSCNNTKSAKMPFDWLIEKFGEPQASEILARIEAYFEWLKAQK